MKKEPLAEAKSASMGMMRKAVAAVNDTLMRLNKRPNGDYENLLAALKSKNSKKFIPMLVPYVEDVIDGIEAKDNSGIFTDSDIVDVADEVADRHMRALGLLDESVSDVLEGVGAYTLKKTKVEKNEGEDGTQTITHYDIMLGGKKVGKLSRDDYFGQVDGELHGKPIPQTAIGSDVQAWLHKFLKSKKGAKFVMQAEAKDCGCDGEPNEEQEFMFAMKKKAKLKESLMAKVKFLRKD